MVMYVKQHPQKVQFKLGKSWILTKVGLLAQEDFIRIHTNDFDFAEAHFCLLVDAI